MALGKIDDPIYYTLSDGVNSTLVNPWGPGDAATALRVIQAGDSVGSVYVNNPTGAGDGATALRIVQAGDFVSSVYVNNPFGQGDTATALRIVQAGDSVGSVFVQNPIAQGDSATALRVIHAGDAVASVYVNNPVNQGDAATALRVIIAGNSDASVTATQTGTWNIGTVTTVTGITNSLAAVNIDSSGVQYSGSNPFPMTIVGSSDSMVSWMARTTNPTAKTDGSDVRPIADKIGRPITYPYQVRDLIGTAFISLATSAGYNTETTLIAIGAAGVSNDIMTLSGSNDSTVAAFFDLRCGTGNASVSKRISLPAGANQWYHEDFLVPFLGEVTTPWTVKAFISGGGSADITGNNVTFNATYIKNV